MGNREQAENELVGVKERHGASRRAFCSPDCAHCVSSRDGHRDEQGGESLYAEALPALPRQLVRLPRLLHALHAPHVLLTGRACDEEQPWQCHDRELQGGPELEGQPLPKCWVT